MKSFFRERKPSSICYKGKENRSKGRFYLFKKSKFRRIVYKLIRVFLENKGIKKGTFQIVYLPNIRKIAKMVEKSGGSCYTINEERVQEKAWKITVWL